MRIDTARVADEVAASRKYRWLFRGTLVRVAAWAVERSESQKEAVARAKRKLHQVYGAYLEGWDPEGAAALIAGLEPNCGKDELRAVCADILRRHASTRERLPFMDALYDRLWEITGVPARIADVGCGLHPFATPWMGLPESTAYFGLEIDTRMAELIRSFFTLAGRQGRIECGDVLVRMPDERADVALLLKMLPSLERQEKGCTERVLRGLDAAHVVVSFPARSLSGREKGMRAHYSATMEETVDRCSWPFVRFELGNEVFFVLDKRNDRQPEHGKHV